MSASSVRRLITPGILARIGAARGFLPFRFGRQALSEPSAIRHRTEPRRFHDRAILVTGIGAPLAVAAMHAGIVIIYIVIFFPARALRSDAVEKFGVLPVGHLIAIDKKFSEINFVLRPLVLRPVYRCP